MLSEHLLLYLRGCRARAQAAAIGEKIVNLEFDVVTFIHNQYEVRPFSTLAPLIGVAGVTQGRLVALLCSERCQVQHHHHVHPAHVWIRCGCDAAHA